MTIYKTVLVYEDGYKQTLKTPNFEHLCDMIDFYIERAKETGLAVKDIVNSEYEL